MAGKRTNRLEQHNMMQNYVKDFFVESNCDFLAEKGNELHFHQEGLEFRVLVHSGGAADTLDNVRKQVSLKANEQKHALHIFYKSSSAQNNALSNIYHRRLDAAVGKKTLKDYSKEQLDKMIHLRELEAKYQKRMSVPHQTSEIVKPVLFYYQPDTKNLKESIRAYTLQKVISNNKHNPQAAYYGGETRETKTYKIAHELWQLQKGKQKVKVALIKKPHLAFEQLILAPQNYFSTTL